ncbi:MAG: FmdB family zinc ribbon protein [Acidimicrobiia bacterium]
MPTYEYRCDECGETLEVFQSFRDKPLKVHEGCGGPLKKVFHPRGVVFKGSGYYVTDSRSNGSATKPKTDTGTKSTDSNGSKKGDESKKADGNAKAEAKSAKSSSTKSDSD